MEITSKIRKRFWQKVEKTDSCWVWRAGVDRNGYGKFQVEGRNMFAHRVSFILSGRNISNGLVIDHICRNQRCVNPDHMEVVTRQENVRRGNSVKVDRSKIEVIKEKYKTGLFTQTELGNIFGISQNEISMIVNNRRFIT